MNTTITNDNTKVSRKNSEKYQQYAKSNGAKVMGSKVYFSFLFISKCSTTWVILIHFIMKT